LSQFIGRRKACFTERHPPESCAEHQNGSHASFIAPAERMTFSFEARPKQQNAMQAADHSSEDFCS